MDRFVGKRLDGRYEIQEIIGVGGMAVVYKARDIIEDRIVAIKILKQEFITNEEFVHRFKNESKAIAVLSHPNIVKVYDVCFGDLIQYIVMEYIDGMTLKEYIERQGSLKWKDAVYYVIQILRALQHAHDKGIVHRDVKPQNIMVLLDGTIKVADFGIARFARSEQLTITDKAIGSVHYISPEQARGEGTDEKSDIYSVGVMLYEMLTGTLPFEAESAVSVAIMQLQREPQLPTSINPAIPKGLEHITIHAMQKSADRRYQSAAEMLCDLEQFKKDPTALFEHNYFVDDSPTKYMNDVMSSSPASAVKIAEEPETAPVQKQKSSTVPILMGVAVALAVLVVGFLVWMGFYTGFFGGGDKGVETQCPNFIGMTKEQVEQSDYYLGNDGWQLKVVFKYESNPNYDKNTVFNQSIAPNKSIKKTSSITLYVSMGKITVAVPDVYEKLESYAVSELKSKKFKTTVKQVPSETVEAGYVVKTEPPRTYVAAEGDEIIVYVSSGKPENPVEVPNVFGLTEDVAKKKIEKEGLIPVIVPYDITSEDTYIKEGYVVKQEPDSSTTILEGSEVQIYVSTGRYIFDVTFALPTDLDPEELHSVSALVEDENDAQQSVSKLKVTDLTEYTFEGLTFAGNSKTRTVEVHIYIDDKLSKTIVVDIATGECTEKVSE